MPGTGGSLSGLRHWRSGGELGALGRPAGADGLWAQMTAIAGLRVELCVHHPFCLSPASYSHVHPPTYYTPTHIPSIHPPTHSALLPERLPQTPGEADHTASCSRTPGWPHLSIRAGRPGRGGAGCRSWGSMRGVTAQTKVTCRSH